MDLQKFDTTLKSALENLEVPFDAGTWTALENRLDALPAQDALDKVVRPALDRIETPYDMGSWSALANRMDRLARVRRLRMTKIAEMAIFLLLLLNLKGFFGIVESVTNPNPVKNEKLEPIAKSRSTKAKNQPASSDHANQNAATNNNLNLAQQVVAMVQGLAATLTQEVENEDITSEANAPQAIASSGSVLDLANFYSQSGMVKFSFGPVLPAHPVEPVLFASSTISIPGFKISKASKPSSFYGATFGTLDKNYLREGDHSDKKTGHGGGLAVGFRKGKWGVEAGLQCTQRSYEPKLKNVIYQDDLNGVSFYHIDKVEAEVFSLPLKATRRIAKLGKSTAHVVAGATANFATSKSYAYQTTHFPPKSGSDPAGPVSPLPNAKGVLENGGLHYNAYATADLGLRMEHPIGKRYIAFVEPIYRQSLGGGLGPNPARLSTFSLQAGVMASL